MTFSIGAALSSPVMPGTKIAVCAVGSFLALLLYGLASREIRAGYKTILFLPILLSLSFPMFVVSAACLAILGDSQVRVSVEIANLWLLIGPVAAIGSVALMIHLVRCRSIAFRSNFVRSFLLFLVLPIWMLLSIADAGFLIMFGGIATGSHVTTVRTPDLRWKVHIYWTGFVDSTDTAYLESNTMLPLTCQILGTVGIDRDGNSKVLGSISPAWDAKSGVLALWQQGRLIGAWNLNPLKEISRDQAYRMAPPGGKKISVAEAYRRRASLGVDGNKIFFDSVRRGEIKALKEMIADGASADTKWDGETSLERAVNLRNVELVNFLLANGADVNATSYDWGSTALQASCIQRNVAIARILLEHGAEVNATIDTGNTALMQASWYGSIELVQLLLDHGADPAMRNDEGDRAIEFALKNRQSAVAALLATADGGRPSTQP